jgi:hypothetical protein
MPRGKILSSVALILLVGCGRSGHRVPPFPPVGVAQRTSVLEAAGKLRDSFNSNTACEAIYSFPSYPKERWMSDCAQLQNDMGSWQAFRPQSVERCGMPEVVICLDGDADFTNGDRIMELTWRLKDGRAELIGIAWQDGLQWIRIPPFPGRKHQDTPPVPGTVTATVL